MRRAKAVITPGDEGRPYEIEIALAADGDHLIEKTKPAKKPAKKQPAQQKR